MRFVQARESSLQKVSKILFFEEQAPFSRETLGFQKSVLNNLDTYCRGPWSLLPCPWSLVLGSWPLAQVTGAWSVIRGPAEKAAKNNPAEKQAPPHMSTGATPEQGHVMTLPLGVVLASLGGGVGVPESPSDLNMDPNLHYLGVICGPSWNVLRRLRDVWRRFEASSRPPGGADLLGSIQRRGFWGGP